MTDFEFTEAELREMARAEEECGCDIAAGCPMPFETETEALSPSAEQLQQAIAAQVEAARQKEREAIAVFLKFFIDDAFIKSGVGTETVRTVHRMSLLVRSGDYLAAGCFGRGNGNLA